MSENHSKDPHDIEIENTDDGDVSHDSDIAEAEEHLGSKLKKTREKLKACEAEKMNHLEELQRVKADFLNSKQRIAKDADRRVDATKSEVLESLLSLYDSFRAAKEGAGNTQASSWNSGIDGIFSQLQKILTDLDAEMIAETGVPFDPEVHEALEQVETDGAESDTVVEVLQVGCVRKNADGNRILIRPARVRVTS